MKSIHLLTGLWMYFNSSIGHTEQNERVVRGGVAVGRRVSVNVVESAYKCF